MATWMEVDREEWKGRDGGRDGGRQVRREDEMMYC